MPRSARTSRKGYLSFSAHAGMAASGDRAHILARARRQKRSGEGGVYGALEATGEDALRGSILGCHTRESGIQCAAPLDPLLILWNTGSPGRAGDDVLFQRK